MCISRLSTNHLKAFTYNCKPYMRERLIDADFLCMSHIFQSTSRLVHLYITRSQQWSQENIDVIEVLISLAAGEHMAPSRNQTPYEEGQESLFTWRTRLPFIISLPYQAAKDGFPSKHGFVGLLAFFHMRPPHLSCISKRASIEKLIAEKGTRISAIERRVPRAW